MFKDMAERHGFKTFQLKNQEQWVKTQVSLGKSVALWTPEECFVYGLKDAISTEFGELLDCIDETKYKLKGSISLPRVLSLFLEGVLDYVVCQEEYICYPSLAHELMQLIYLASQKSNENLSARITSDKLKLDQIKLDPFLQNLLGKLLSVEKRLNEASVCFRDAVELSRNFGEPYGNLGTLLWSMGKQREGFLLMTEALLKNPYSISAQLNFFEAGYEMREYSGMARVIESLLTHVVDYPEFRHHLAICYQKTGKGPDAIDLLKNIIKEYPGDEDAKKILNSITNQS